LLDSLGVGKRDLPVGEGGGGFPDDWPVNTIRAVSMRNREETVISNGGNKVGKNITRGNYAQRVLDFVLLIVEHRLGRGTYNLNKEIIVNNWLKGRRSG